MGRLLWTDDLTGDKAYHHYDNDISYIETVYNVEPILQANKEAQKDRYGDKKGIKAGWWHAGSIPNGVIAKWKTEGIDFFTKDPDHWKMIVKLLNSPDYRYLRTGSGKI
jgi:hypothetical protein